MFQILPFWVTPLLFALDLCEIDVDSVVISLLIERVIRAHSRLLAQPISQYESGTNRDTSHNLLAVSLDPANRLGQDIPLGLLSLLNLSNLVDNLNLLVLHSINLLSND